MSKTIHEILAAWGSSQRQLPPSNTALKASLLARAGMQEAHAEPVPHTRNIPWLSLGFATMAAVSLLVLNTSGTDRSMVSYSTVATNTKLEKPTDLPVPTGVAATAPSAQSVEQRRTSARSDGFYGADKKAEPELQNFAAGNVSMESMPYSVTDSSSIPIVDQRQYLRTDYGAGVESRNVPKTVNKLQLLIRGFDGRVDNLRSSKENGFLEFVVPASKFSTFQSDVRSLVGDRFLMENITAENMLPEKRAIEDARSNAESYKKSLTETREQFTAEHNRVVSSLQGQIGSLSRQLATLEAKVGTTPEEQTALENQKKAIRSNRANLQYQLTSENEQQQYRLEDNDNQIKSTEATIEATHKQDQNLVDTVATVRGTISINYISLSEFVTAYVPGYMISVILFALALLAFGYNRRTKLAV